MDCWSLACHRYADPWARRNHRHELIAKPWSWNNAGAMWDRTNLLLYTRAPDQRRHPFANGSSVTR